MEQLTYEKALAELQTIVGAIENEEVSIDDLSTKISRATELIKYCRQKLRNTEAEITETLKDLEG